MAQAPHRLLLIGAGHGHVEVLRRFAQVPAPGILLTLANPDVSVAYSGMLPGTVAGHYTIEESSIDLALLTRWAKARFVVEGVRALDPVARNATLQSGEIVHFDSASIDIGSEPDMTLPGAREHAVGVKPIHAFLDAWNRLLAEAQDDRVASVAVVGGGAGGSEIALAMQHHLRQLRGTRAPPVALVSDELQLPRGPSRRLAAIMQQRGIALHLGSAVAGFAQDGIHLQSGATLSAARIFATTSATAAPWLAASGLACDARGFLRVGAKLQSISHPGIFAAGDCASQDHHPRPKSGVFAVRQGPVLAINLRNAALRLPLASFVPQRHALALISTGDRHAIATRGPFTLAGAWVWRWKNRIDRRFVARYRPP